MTILQKLGISKKSTPVLFIAGVLILLSVLLEIVRILISYPTSNTITTTEPSKKIEGDVFNNMHKRYKSYKTIIETLKQDKIDIFPHNPILGDINSKVELVIFYDNYCSECRKKLANTLKHLLPVSKKIKLIYKSVPEKRKEDNGNIFDIIAADAGIFPQYLKVILQKNKLETNDYFLIFEKLGIPFEKQRELMENSFLSVDKLQLDIDLAEKLKILDNSHQNKLPILYLNGYRIEQENLPIIGILEYIENLLGNRNILGNTNSGDK